MGKTKTAFVGDLPDEKKMKKHKADKPVKVHVAGLKGGQRIKAIEAEPIVDAPTSTDQASEKKAKGPKVRSKKYQAGKVKINREKMYSISEAIKLIKEVSYSKFDGTMEMHIVVKKTGLSAQVTLPFSAGRSKKVEIANDETIKKLAEGKIDFDVLLATAEMMPKLVVFAKLLGPRGLMPNPKNGTLITDAKKAASFNTNAITLKTEKEAPLVHTTFGKVSQKDEELVKNAEAIIKAMGEGKQIVRAFISASMSPAVRLQI